MKSNFSRRLARLARSLWGRPAARAAARQPFRPALECLEGRALLSTLTVVNLNDNGAGSLRYELAQAHPGDTVAFAPRLHGTITLTSGELQVGQDVTIQGPGAGRLAISGNHASRVFEILGGADVTLSGLTITGGVANPAGSAFPLGSGGGIAVDRGATLTLTGAVVTGNIANAASAAAASVSVSGSGGGIYNAGTLTMIADVVRGNTANAGSALGGTSGEVDGSGGGIYNAGTLTAAESVVDGNTANAGASSYVSGGEGGGIYSSGTLSLTNVSVSNSTAEAGPVMAAQFGATSGFGGGLFIAAGTATVEGSVFASDTGNSASASAAGPGLSVVDVQGDGGAIANSGRLTVTDTLFAGDVANSGSASAHSAATVAGYGGAIENFFT